MSSSNPLQKRLFLTLRDESEEDVLAREMLKSPLGLSHEILKCLFENQFETLRLSLDEIKGFTAGVTSARKKSDVYKIASYYDYMFSFHQFVHSSFRARQGKVLEAVLDQILAKFCGCEIYETGAKKLKRLSEIYGVPIPQHDIDSFGVSKENKKVMLVQIRSRDDTGGATAKGSLVELVNELVKLPKDPQYEVTYLILVWVALDSNQKNTLITKCYESIHNVIPSLNKKNFIENISSGVEIKKNLKLKLDYSLEEFSETLKVWAEKDTNFEAKIKNLIQKIENWDDLWVSYAIANIELEGKTIKGKNNFEILQKKLKENKLQLDYSSYEKLENSIDNVTIQLIPLWHEESLPVISPADQILYIRDLLYLTACYKNFKGDMPKKSKSKRLI